jgi:hypothetical protein
MARTFAGEPRAWLSRRPSAARRAASAAVGGSRRCGSLDRRPTSGWLGLRAANAPALHARFIPTAKNAPAADFLPNHGFTRLDDTRFVIAADALPARPAHLQIDLD